MSKDTPQPSCPPQNYPPGEAVPPSYAEAVGSQPCKDIFVVSQYYCYYCSTMLGGGVTTSS